MATKPGTLVKLISVPGLVVGSLLYRAVIYEMSMSSQVLEWSLNDPGIVWEGKGQFFLGNGANMK